jgi:phosphate transport system substrate-binding protein
MSKTRSPFPTEQRANAPLVTIRISKKAGLALLAGIVVVAVGTALALRGKAEIPATGATQVIADTTSAVSTNASPSLRDPGPSADSISSIREDTHEVEPQPYHPPDDDARPVEIRPVDVSPLDIKPVDVKPVDVKAIDVPVLTPESELAPTPAAADALGSTSPPSDVSDSTVVIRPALGRADLNGAGATFPSPIYQKWFQEFHQLHAGVKVNYQPIGSGGGIAQLQRGTVDFGASDGPMSDDQLEKTPFKVFHIPTVLGAVVLIYNLPGVNAELKFTPDVIADIYLGNIKKWSDPRLAKANAGVQFPDIDVVPVHRTDGSGTTYIFTDYLSKVSTDWANGPKKATSINWPVGLGGRGSDGVAGTVKQTPGGIGYVELVYALANNMSYGSVQNAAGQFVRASLQSVTMAAAAVRNMPDDLRVSITNAPGRESYPIASFTWLLVPAEWNDATKGRTFVEFLNWMAGEGQKMTSELWYAPLPANVQAKVRARIKEIKVKPEKPAKQ